MGKKRISEVARAVSGGSPTEDDAGMREPLNLVVRKGTD